MIKITFIITALDQGGAEKTLIRLMKGLKKNNEFKISLICLLKPGALSKEVADLDIAVNYLEMNRKNFLIKFIPLIKLLKKQRPDIVQTWMYHANLLGGIAAKFAGCKRVVWGIRALPRLHKLTTHVINKISAWLSYKLPTAIVYCAQSGQDGHIRYGYTKGKSFVISNGYDLKVFSAQQQKQNLREFNLPQDAILFGYLGRNHQNKNLLNLVNAAEIIVQQKPNVYFSLCGCDVHLLEPVLRSKKLENHFLILPSTEEPQNYLRALDFFVLPSRIEAFPNVVVEAMACGVPCVVTDVGDAAYIVGDTGLVVQSDNPKALANSCLKMLELSEEARLLLSKRAQKRVAENFALNKMLAAYEALYRKILA